jgi:membrane-associated HD superfamily phosphohydrolase
MTVKEYLALNRTFSNEVLGIRGNRENLQKLKEIQVKGGFKNLGAALDYVITAFENIENLDVNDLLKKEEALSKQVTELKEDISKQITVIQNLTNRIAELRKIESITLQKEYNELKKGVEKLIERQIDDSDLFLMLTDFAKEDPGEKILHILEEYEINSPEIIEKINDLCFPLKKTVEKLYPELFKTKTYQNETTV